MVESQMNGKREREREREIDRERERERQRERDWDWERERSRVCARAKNKVNTNSKPANQSSCHSLRSSGLATGLKLGGLTMRPFFSVSSVGKLGDIERFPDLTTLGWQSASPPPPAASAGLEAPVAMAPLHFAWYPPLDKPSVFAVAAERGLSTKLSTTTTTGVIKTYLI